MTLLLAPSPTPRRTPRPTPPAGGDSPDWDTIGRGAVVVVLAAILACLLTRWVFPLLLRVITPAAVDLVAVAATLVVLPEFLTTTALRRTGRSPWKASYVFGDAVAWSAVTAQTVTRSLLLGLSVVIRRMPLVLVGAAAGGAVLVRLLSGG